MKQSSTLPSAAPPRTLSPRLVALPEAFDVRMAAVLCAAAIGWTVFVFSGELVAYWLAAVLTVGPCAVLGRRRHWLAALAPVATAVLLGTELRGELGTTVVAPLNGLRLLELVLLATTAGVLSSSTEIRAARGVTALRGLLSPWRWVAVAVALVTVLWIAQGAPLDQLTKTDLRLMLLGGSTFYIARAVVPGNERALVAGLVAIGALAALKAIALHVSELWAIGTYDRAQATQVATEPKRTILVGGDTLLILVPGLAVALVTDLRAHLYNAGLAAAALLSGVAVLLSGTRSSLLVACALAVAAPLLVWDRARLPRGRQALLILGALAVVVVTATVVSGVGERFTRDEAQDQGLGFRENEVRTFAQLPNAELLLGQGIGGRFTSVDSSGNVVITAWSHVLPVWVGLKVGLLGLALLTAIGGVALWRTLRRTKAFGPRTGALMLAGLLVMSLMIGRAALPEGVILVACCFILLGWGTPSAPTED